MRRTAFGVVAVVVGLALLVGAGLALTSGGGTSVGDNVVVNQQGLIDVRNSPTIARNPTNGANLVTTYRMDRPGYSAFLSWTDNGGQSWQQNTLPLPADTPSCAAVSAKGEKCPFGPDAAFGADGTLYVLYVALKDTGNDPGSLWLSTSTDGGKTLAPPAKVSGPLAFQARIAVDPKGPVYITWLQGFGTGNLSFTEPFPYVVSVRSDDKGRTFSPQVRVSDAARQRIGGPSPVVDSKGRLQVVYTDYKDNRRDFSALPGPAAENPFALVLTTSSDGGKTFAPNHEVESGMTVLRRFLIYLPEYPQIAAGKGDDLYVTWADGRSGDEDVLLRRSTDGGATWADAVRVNDDNPKDGTMQFLPKVDVAPNGRVSVLFLDGRNDPAKKIMLDAYLATSTDGGKNFKNIRLSAVSFDSTVGPTFGPDYGTDFGTKLGLTTTNDKAYAAWTDTHLGNPATGRQDVSFASADLGGGGGSSGVLVVGAVVLLLLLGGGFLLARSLGGARSAKAGRASSTEPSAPDQSGVSR